jgi:tRNA pseudouridine13 synthase
LSAPDDEARPRIRSIPEDFRVEEIPLYPPSGEGEHTFVLIEKRMRTSEEIARMLAREAGVSPRDVGYAGRKDRAAVTRQWYSLPAIDPEHVSGIELVDAHIVEAVRHRHKLRTGHLRGNRFEIRVRGVDEAGARLADDRLSELEAVGMPNRFGPQRFGRAGDNPARAMAILGGAKPPKNRRDTRFLFSALQAKVFNDVLAARPLALDHLEKGDLAMKCDSGGVFLVEDPELENPRAQAFEISPTGPIFGTKMTKPEGDPARREAEALMKAGWSDQHMQQLPRGVRLPGARRALRVQPQSLSLSHDSGDAILRFELPAGSFATVLLEELFGRVIDAGGSDSQQH